MMFVVVLEYLWKFSLDSSSANDKFSKLFVNKISDYTKGKVKFVTIWNNRKIQSLFNYKDKVQHHRCVTYRVICPSDGECIDETFKNSEVRWKEHSTGRDENFDCKKHLIDNLSFEFLWFALSRASKNCLIWEILQMYYIKTLH